MRHTSARALRHRLHSTRPRLPLAARLRAVPRSAPWWAPSLAALLAIAVALSGAGTIRDARGTQTLSPAHPWVGHASAPGALPPLARWQDVKDGTAYALHVTQATASFIAVRGGNLFTFTTPSGDQIAGQVPLVKLPDQSYAQTTSKDPAQLGGCQAGTLIASGQASTPNSPVGASGTQQVVFALQAHFDQYLLAAYAQILYGPASDKTAITAVCAGDASAPGVTDLTMSAGCTAASCTSPLDDAMSAPPAYEQAIIHAMQQRGQVAWSAVWALTSRVVTAQYTQAEFATLMNQLSDKTGKITAMAPASGSPTVSFDSGGQAYFSLVESVTYSRGGKSTTVHITSYYLLEGGAWMFWFSEPYSA